MTLGNREAWVEVTVPGDKSISHRALILASLSRGTSLLRGVLAGADTQATSDAMRALGVATPVLPSDGGEFAVRGHGLRGLRAPDGVIDCGNSGTTARLLLGLLSGVPFSATLTGDDSLRSRPMRRVTEPLERAGARFEELGEADRLPIRVTGGALRRVDHESPKASAQVKSALLLAGLSAGVPVQVTEPVISRDHTERMLRAMGAEVESAPTANGRWRIVFQPPEFLEPIDVDVPGDFSSAAFFIALAAAWPGGAVRIAGVGVNPTRVGMLEVMSRMGAPVALENSCEVCGEPVADVIASAAQLKGTTIEADEVPSLIDEIPILAVLAARAEGETTVRGASELRVKESDRIRAVVDNLRAVGVEAEELEDGFVVRGTDAPLSGTVESHGDHRIAMAFGVLGALPGNRIEIDEPDVVGVSYPTFWETLGSTAASLER